MKFKLSKLQFETLYGLLQRTIILIKPKGIQQRLLHGVLMGFYKKMYTKAFNEKKTYTVRFDEFEACAFWLLYNSMPYDVPVELQYERNQVRMICDAIHQKLAV